MTSWKKIVGYEEYEVSDTGEVRRDGKILRKQNNKRGQHTVSLSKNGRVKTLTVSRLVAKAFLQQEPGKNVVCHKDNNPLNNDVSNLKWGTHIDNELDKITNGTTNKGESNGRAKLKEADVLEIHKLYLDGISQPDIAEKYCISPKTVNAIINFRYWKHLRSVIHPVSNPVLCSKVPYVINGGNFVDDRGVLTFFNSFSFIGIKRFYQVENTSRDMIRAWHGHNLEAKFVYVPRGTALVGAAPLVQSDNMNEPGGVLTIKPPGEKFVLSSRKPSILFLPPGYANGFKNLEDNTVIMFFSTTTLDESKGDDIRFDWNIIPGFWEEVFR